MPTEGPPPGVTRDDSDDELGLEDHPWEWIYECQLANESNQLTEPSKKRKRVGDSSQRIVGARMGQFECRVGDCVLLKAEGSHEAWVGLISEFLEDEEDGDKAANFLWFSTEKEISNKTRKRMDFLPNELYITPTSDINSLASINGKAVVMSPAEFSVKYPNGKIPRRSPGYNKTFVCRRGCNTRTASYTDEFIWEELYKGEEEDVPTLLEYVVQGTTATRRRGKRQQTVTDTYENELDEQVDDDITTDMPDISRQKNSTPKKRQKTSRIGTPSHRKVVIKKALEFTPLATRTLDSNHSHNSPFQVARAQLHVASVPTSLPCREAEFSLVYSHLEAAITDGSGACIYISGTPGTGKTATVREVVSTLDAAVQAEELDDFIFVEINGMKITDPHQAYSLLWEALKGQRVSPSQALDLLEREFHHPSPRRVPCVVLMDELDQLVTKNQGVMYNFFNWPGLRHSRLIVLAVANTMDLPERTLSNKISSRLGLTRITFPGYHHEQLMKIIQSRLEGVPDHLVDPDAVQFASRKVAAVSGDARRALDICRRAVELAEAEAKGAGVDPATPTKAPREKAKHALGKVTIATVKRAINEATSSPLQQFLRSLPYAGKLLLTALLLRMQRTGLPETTYGDLMEEVGRALALDAGNKRGLLFATTGEHRAFDGLQGHKSPRESRARGLGAAAVNLTGAGIIILESQRLERPSKIRLAVGDEELKLALRDDPEIRNLGIAF